MKQQPFIGIIKDTHLTQNNWSTVSSIFEQFISLLKQKGIKYAIHLGDFFSERTGGHNIDRLMAVGAIIRMFIDAEITLYAIAGNHEKADLTHDFSYLSVYDVVAQSEYFNLFNEYGFVDLNGIRFHFISYYTEGEPYLQQLVKVKYKSNLKNVLCTHVAVNGIRNNDGSIVETGISIEAFKKFDVVYIGHYHAESQLKPNIFYLPGSWQQSFGEPEKMGFTLLSSDLSTTFHQSEFKKFKQMRVQASDKKALAEITKELKNIDRNEYNVCLKIQGNVNEIESLDVSQLKELQVVVKYENTTETIIDFETPEQIEKTMLTKSDLLKHYLKYAQEFGFTAEQRSQGLKLLKTI